VGLIKGDLEKVPKGLTMNQYYARIFKWHRKNKDLILRKLGARSPSDPYIRCYFELVEALPDTKSVSLEDIAFVCLEVISGLMEWAYHESDQHGVKTAAYAQHILDSFFDGFFGKKTRFSAENSKMYARYNMSNCLRRYKEQ